MTRASDHRPAPVDAAGARSIARRVADSYDDLVYDPSPPEPEFAAGVFGIGSLYGCDAAMGDVLDLGCGTGRYLHGIASGMSGRAVGVDLSAAAVDAARALCAPLGARAEILHADLLDLTPAALGTFDLITNVGVHYVVPREARRHLAMLMGACLRPGGIAVVSYYTGPLALACTAVNALLRALDDPDASAQARVAAARRTLAALDQASAGTRQKALVDACARSLSGLKDATLFHEVFNAAFEVLDTFGLAEEMRLHGLRFLNFIQPATINGMRTSHERVKSAAALDVLSGGYRFAIFGKTGDADALFDIAAPRARWRLLATHRPDLAREGISVYDPPKAAQQLELSYPLADFALQRMAGAGATLAEIHADAARLLPGFDTPADTERLAENLRTLWGMGAIVPLRDR